jgi:hypothetical protein
MNLSYNDLFFKILTILNYQNRENFVKGIEERNHMEAITNCIEKLPQKVRNEVIANPHDPEIIKKYIINDVYLEEINKVSAKALSAFLQHMTPVLSDSQKQQIAAVFPN